MFVMFHIEFDGNLEERLNLFSREESPLQFIGEQVFEEGLEEDLCWAKYLFHFKNSGEEPMEIVYGNGHYLSEIDGGLMTQGRETYGQNCELVLAYVGPRFPELTKHVGELLDYMKQQRVSFAILPTAMSGAHVLATGYNAKNGHVGKQFKEALRPIFAQQLDN